MVYNGLYSHMKCSRGKQWQKYKVDGIGKDEKKIQLWW